MEILDIEEVLEMVIGGIPGVARVIAAIPADDRVRALAAAKSSYLRTVRDFGYGEVTAQNLVSTVDRILRAEVELAISEAGTAERVARVELSTLSSTAI
jgi:hypothetical protein